MRKYLLTTITIATVGIFATAVPIYAQSVSANDDDNFPDNSQTEHEQSCVLGLISSLKNSNLAIAGKTQSQTTDTSKVKNLTDGAVATVSNIHPGNITSFRNPVSGGSTILPFEIDWSHLPNAPPA